MKILNSGGVVRLAVGDIEVGSRLRGVSEVQLENLLAMAEDTGITTPIHVRKAGGRYVLIDGAHRLAATKRLGLPDIACLVVECREDEARAMEASNNLGAARMSPVQTVIFAASWKRDYYELHPDRKPGVFKGNRYQPKVVSAQNALTTSLAASFGRKPRQMFKILAIGERLTAQDAQLLERATAPVTLEDLAVIGKIGEPDERAAVIAAVVEGKKAGAARAAWKAVANGVQTPVRNKFDDAAAALRKAWAAAPEAAKRQFCEDLAAQLLLRLKVAGAQGGDA